MILKVASISICSSTYKHMFHVHMWSSFVILCRQQMRCKCNLSCLKYHRIAHSILVPFHWLHASCLSLFLLEWYGLEKLSLPFSKYKAKVSSRRLQFLFASLSDVAVKAKTKLVNELMPRKTRNCWSSAKLSGFSFFHRF